ncbi:MAG TPA: D-lyxose/D-mannose family sugar isomerase, partial [Flexilinea sp.]|nr:D-lyxose/D-mannose family sugar isomerase [Flexilinea sp.]
LHEILTKEMGWDITDFALDDFYHRGMLLFTIRNGSTPETGYDKPYCEKIMILEDGQKCLLHFHWDKVEDIINRGGGTLKLQFYNATADEQLDQKNPVILYVDGIRTEIEPGGILSLVPGQSVTLPQRNYHSFWGDGKVLVGEVSKVNDDHTDNRFFDPIPRFPKVIEDEPIFRPMIGDYKNL